MVARRRPKTRQSFAGSGRGRASGHHLARRVARSKEGARAHPSVVVFGARTGGFDGEVEQNYRRSSGKDGLVATAKPTGGGVRLA